MNAHVPEPDPHDTASPLARRKHSPVPKSFCSICRKEITKGAARCRACLDASRTKTKVEKPPRDRSRCRKGHDLSVYGHQRGDAGTRCRLCNAANKRAYYHRQKEATA